MTDAKFARERLIGMMSFNEAANHGITPEDAVDDAIRQAILEQPDLRTCLTPGCLRQYDNTTHMLGRPPVRPEWSGEGWHKVTRGCASGDLCPDHVDIVTAHLPRTIDLPNGRWTVHCACGWETTPQAWGGLLRPLWEQHLLTAMGKLPVPPEPVTEENRLPLAEHTDDSLRELYDRLEDTEHDREVVFEAAQAMYRSWDWHRKVLGDAARAINAVRNQMRVNSRDWAADRGDAYLWAVLIGWDDEALQEVAAKHRWNEHRVKYVREMRALLAPLTDPQSKENEQP